MENMSIWLAKVAHSDYTEKTYRSNIKPFINYAESKGFRIDALKTDYREAKYRGEAEKERFLDGLRDLIDGYNCVLKDSGCAPLTEKIRMATVSSFLKNGCSIKDIEFSLDKHAYPKFHNRDITKEDIKKILEHATSLRDRVFFLMMCESGLRPSTLVNLRYQNIKQDFEAERVPMKIDLPSSILKDRVSARFTFIGEDGHKLLKEYLSTRGDLNDEDLLFLPEREAKSQETFSYNAYSTKFGRLVRRVKLVKTTGERKPQSLRLYSLRKYFFNNMKCDSAFREYWFCHKSVDDHYITQFNIERHREEYVKGYESLRIFEAGPTEQIIKKQVEEIDVLKRQVADLQRDREQRLQKVEALEALLKRVEELEKKLEPEKKDGSRLQPNNSTKRRSATV